MLGENALHYYAMTKYFMIRDYADHRYDSCTFSLALVMWFRCAFGCGFDLLVHWPMGARVWMRVWPACALANGSSCLGACLTCMYWPMGARVWVRVWPACVLANGSSCFGACFWCERDESRRESSREESREESRVEKRRESRREESREEKRREEKRREESRKRERVGARTGRMAGAPPLPVSESARGRW